MKNLVVTSVLFACALLLNEQLPGFAEEPIVYTVKSEHDSVVVPLIGGFKFSGEQKMGSIRAVEFYLPGESLKNYTRLLSMMITSNTELKQSPREIMQKMVDVQKHLKETMPGLKLSVEFVETTSDDDVLIKSVNGDVGTTIFTRTVKGTDGVYQFQYQFHSATVSKEDEQKAIASLKELSVKSTAAAPFEPVVLKASPYEISSKTEKLSIPVGTDWKIVEDKTREPMPFFQYAKDASVHTITLVPVAGSLESFAKMLKIEILPADKAAMKPRAIMKMGADSIPSFDGCKFAVIDDRSDNDVTYDATFSKPIDTPLAKIGTSEIISRIVTGADSQYRISMMFPTANVEAAQKTAAVALLKEIKIVPLTH